MDGTTGITLFSQPLFSSRQALDAMRDSQYRSAALALSELIDNAIDAFASQIDVICIEERQLVQQREHWKIKQIGVADNGDGMPAEVLVKALAYGERVPGRRRRTIGKYGMGLPTSSISQCLRVDVWTWQSGEVPWHCYIDVEIIKSDTADQATVYVPEPNTENIPAEWVRVVDPEIMQSAHGTLVVWSKIDRVKGKADTIFRQIEEEIGRIYRHMINEEVSIRMASYRGERRTLNEAVPVKPNDPLYLTAGTSTPSPWSDTPMFEEWARETYDVTVEGRAEQVTVIYSIVKEEVIKQARAENRNPGDYPFGKHAARNRGVSVIREDREILLENLFVSGGGSSRDPQNRWWGCEVRFGSGCDTLFGVDHNKQMAAHFSRVAKELTNDDDIQLTLDGLDTEDHELYKIVTDISRNISALRRDIDVVFARNRAAIQSSGQSVVDQANATATQANKEALVSGQMELTSTDSDRSSMSQEERRLAIEQVLIDEGQSATDAHEAAERIIERDDWYTCGWDTLPGSQMFNVKNVGGVYRIILNTAHPIYEFIRVIEEASEDNPVARKAAVGIILMLQSWGHMEQQIANLDRKRAVQNTAHEWGLHVDEFISRLNSEG